ncbi:MAG: serpin family protein [Mediterranea sp.]|nr:serpin family protein [Mediterranea sp.]
MKLFTLLFCMIIISACTSTGDDSLLLNPQDSLSNEVEEVVENTTPAELPERMSTELIELELSELEKNISNGSNAFAIKWFKQAIQTTDQRNLVLSPLSASYALAMTANGAKGNTLSEFKSVLGFADYTLDEVNAFYKKITNHLLTSDGQTILGIANSIWVNQLYQLQPDFITTNKEYYSAEVRAIDCLDSPTTLAVVNQWVSDKTYGRIPSILDKVEPSDRVYLINALYFDGLWLSPMTEGWTINFTNDDGKIVPIPVIGQKRSMNYFTDEEVEIASADYGNRTYSMVVIMPKENLSIQRVIESLTSEKWQMWMERQKKENLFFKLPIFKLDSSRELKDDLEALGLLTAFNDKANFTNMIQEKGIALSQVIQKANIDVNKYGTTASAATLVKNMWISDFGSSEEPTYIDFLVNRPFIFAIRENSTNTILFMGKVGKL